MKMVKFQKTRVKGDRPPPAPLSKGPVMQERGGAIIRKRLICLIVLVVASYIVNVLRTHFQFGLNGVAKFLTSKQAFSENEAFN